MKKKMLVLVIALMLIGVNSFAADGDVIVNGNLTVNGRLILSKFYDSGEQTITSGGTLTLVHNLGIEPTFIQVILKCITAEAGYSVGDKLFINPNITKSGTSNQGIVVVPDATNLNIRFGALATYVFAGLTKNTGTSVNLTNTKWKVIFRAWAF